MESFNIGICFNTEKQSLYALDKIRKLVPGTWRIDKHTGESIDDGKTVTLFVVVGMLNNKDEYDMACKYLGDIYMEFILPPPHIIGNVNAIGSWSGKDTTMDLYSDVITAISMFPEDDKPFYILANKKTINEFNRCDSERVPFYEYIVPLFSRSTPTSCESVRYIVDNAIKHMVLRESELVSDGVVYVVSEKNAIVVIETEPNGM